MVYWIIHTTRDQEHDRYKKEDREQWVLMYCTEMFTLVRDREKNQDPLFPTVLVQFPVPDPVPLLCCVIKLLVSTEVTAFDSHLAPTTMELGTGHHVIKSRDYYFKVCSHVTKFSPSLIYPPISLYIRE